jgi:hypothetical protein
MAMPRRIFTGFLILSFLIVSTISCKKDIEEPKPVVIAPAEPVILADKQTVSPLEIVSLSCENISLSQVVYSGSIASHTVSLSSYQNKLGFQVPDLPAGNYVLQSTIEGKAFSINLTVVAPLSISDPDSYIQTAITKFEHSASYLTMLANATANMHGAENNAANISILNNYFDELQNKMNAASAQDKAALAKFIAANPVLFAPLEDISLYIDSLNLNKTSGYSDDRIKTISPEIANKIFNLGLVTVVGVSLQLIALGSPEPVTKLLAFAGWAAVAFRIYNLNTYLIEQLDKSLIQVGQIIVDDIHKTATTYQFKKDVPYTFELSSAYRNLSAQDVGSSSSIVASIVSSLNKFETYWNKAMSILPKSLSGGPFHLKNVSSVKTKIWKIKPSYLSIANISNNNVKVSVENAGGIMKATFTTPLSVDQNFNFDITYTNPGVSSGKSNYGGNLIASSFMGSWNCSSGSTHLWVVSCPSQVDTCLTGVYNGVLNILPDSSFTLTAELKTKFYNIVFSDIQNQNLCQIVSDNPDTDVTQFLNFSGTFNGTSLIFDMDGDGNEDHLPISKFGPEVYITLDMKIDALQKNRPFDMFFSK